MIIQWPKEGKPDLRADKLRKLKEAHARAQKQARERSQSARPRTGNIRLSNTDSLRTAMAVRRRVLAKLAEVAGATDVEPRTRGAMVATVQMQLDRVDRQIAAIRRRERALEEEKRAKRDECPRKRRRRLADMKEKSIYIRRDFLYDAKDGGFDPRNPANVLTGTYAADAAVTFSMGGAIVGAMPDAPADVPSVEVTL